MTEAKKYRIRVPGALIEVTHEVYLTYYRMDRHARHLEEKDVAHGKVLYSDMDTEDLVGEEVIPDSVTPSVEEMALDRVMMDKLRKCLLLLTRQEKDLVDGLYFQKLNESQLAVKTGIPRMTIHDRHKKILSKLKRLMD